MEPLVLGLVACLGFASYALWSRAREREGRRHPRPPSEERTLITMQVGDVVEHLGSDYVVEGALTFSQEGRGARLYRLSDAGRERWLFARSDRPEALLLEGAPELRLEGSPPDRLAHAGAPYRVAARARAQVARVGAVGERRPGERVWLLEYSGPGPHELLLIDWGEHVEAFAGERLAAHAFEILPAR